MSNHVQAPTADCRHCLKPIRQNKAGIWGARSRDDSQPWYCDAGPGTGKRHEPVAEGDTYEVTWPDGSTYGNRFGQTRLSAQEARATAPVIGGTWRRATGQED